VLKTVPKVTYEMVQFIHLYFW